MTDIVERLRVLQSQERIFTASYQDPCKEAADEIERLRDMCINREEFIAKHNLWKEFSQYLNEQHSAVSSTDSGDKND